MFYGCSNLKINSTGTGTLFLTMPSGTISKGAVAIMFLGTGGTYRSNPVAGGTYYFE